MTQDECLALPGHFTHPGVCYPGSSASLIISNPNNPQPVQFHATSVPEPATAPLFCACARNGRLVLAHQGARR